MLDWLCKCGQSLAGAVSHSKDKKVATDCLSVQFWKATLFHSLAHFKYLFLCLELHLYLYTQ